MVEQNDANIHEVHGSAKSNKERQQWLSKDDMIFFPSIQNREAWSQSVMLYIQTYDCIAIRRVKHNAHHRFQEGSDWNLVLTVANFESSKRPTEILHPVVCMAIHSTQHATSLQLLTAQAHPRTHNQQPCEPSEHNH